MKIKYYTTCDSQSFGGHHLPVVQVMVDGRTRYKEVKELLLTDDNTNHLDELFTPSDWEQYGEAVDHWFNELPKEISLNDPFDNQLLVPTVNEDWNVYAYFIIEVNVNDKME